MKAQAGAQSPAESVAQNAANSLTPEENFAEIPAQIAVGQTFAPAVSDLWEDCGGSCGKLTSVPSAALGTVLSMAQSVPPAALAVPSAAQAVPPAAPTYIQYINNRNSIYSNGLRPTARACAQAAQQWEKENRTSNTEGLNLEPMSAEASAGSTATAQVSACDDEASAYTPSFTILEEIDLTFPRKHSSQTAELRKEQPAQPQLQTQTTIQPQVSLQSQPVPQFSPVSQPAQTAQVANAIVSAVPPRQGGRSNKVRAAVSSIGFNDVLKVLTEFDVRLGYTSRLKTSVAAMAGEIVAHYTADGRNWCIGRSRTTLQTLPALCQRYIELALEQGADKPKSARARGARRTRAASAAPASSAMAASTKPQNAFISAYGKHSAYDDNNSAGDGGGVKPAAGYVERPDNFNLPPAPGELTDGEKIFGSNAAVLAAMQMGGM